MWESINKAASYVGTIVAPLEDADEESSDIEGEENHCSNHEAQQLQRENTQLQRRIQDMERQFLHNNAAMRQLLDARQQELERCACQIELLKTQVEQHEQHAEASTDQIHAVPQPLEPPNRGDQVDNAVEDHSWVNGKETDALAASVEKLESELQQQRMQANEHKAQLVVSHEEVRKLKEVINQLRSAGKRSATELETLRNENEQLKYRLQSKRDVVEDRRNDLQQATVDADLVEQALHQLAASSEQVEQLEGALLERSTALQLCEAELEHIRKQHATDVAVLQKQYEEELSSTRVAGSDLELVCADLRDREAQLANLQAALAQLEEDKAQEVENMKQQFQQHLAEVNRAHQQEIQKSNAEVLRRADVELQAAREATQQATAETAKMQALQRQQTRDNQSLRAALDKAIASLQRPREDAVDRELITNLIVSYFQRRRSSEILELIARVLDLNEDQLRAVGLRRETGFFSAIVGRATEEVPQPPTPQVEIDASSLSELWVNFLMNEAHKEDHL